MSDKLTLEEIDELIEFGSGVADPCEPLWKQLADTMRESERLRNELTLIWGALAHPITDELVAEIKARIERALCNKDTDHGGDANDMIPDAGNATKDTAEK